MATRPDSDADPVSARLASARVPGQGDGSMIWDPCLASAVAAELSGRLCGARARALSFRREEQEVVVYFRDATLVADLAPKRGVVVLDPPAEPEGDAEPLPAVLTGVEAVWDERVLVLRFRRVRGRKPNPALILELATNRRNAIIADGPQLRVRKRLRHVKGRPLRIGQPWVPPGGGAPEGARREVDGAEWRGLVEGLGEEEARAALLTRVAQTSGLNVGALLDAPGSGEGFRLWRRMASGAEVSPHLLRRSSGLQPYPWRLGGVQAEAIGSLLEAMARVRAEGDDAPSPATGRVARRLAAESRRLKRKLKRLRAQLEKTADADQLRGEGALILSSLHLIEPGATEVTLSGFDGSRHRIHLDPRRKPQDHANALFRRAGRLERGAATLPHRIRAAEEDLARIATLRERHRRGDLSPEETDALTLPPSPPSRSRPTFPTLPYRSYTSSGGLEIRVGRGARRNDDLTFHHSRPMDIWLHARHAAGAHVILRWTHPERPPAADLDEAAVLAANHSGARASGTVPVDWTRRKWVRKPRGTPPGAVIPDRVQTVFVAPDPSLAERLSESGPRSGSPAPRSATETAASRRGRRRSR